MAVDSPSADYVLMSARWKQMRDCVRGSLAIKSVGEAYLSPLEGHKVGRELTDQYHAYKARALYYNATARTIDGLTGMVFRRPPIINLPKAAESFELDIDGEGTTIADFADSILGEDLEVGRVGILVDHTRPEPVEGGLVPIGMGRASDFRPYLTLYQTEQILDVVWQTFGGVRKPVQVRLLELDEGPSDIEFETVTVERVRVLELVNGVYQQRVFVSRSSRSGPPLTSATDPRVERRQSATFEEKPELAVIPTLPNGNTIDHIPFWVVGTGKSKGGKIDPPPLLDLADVNLAHYRQDADYRNALHVAGVPTPVFVNVGVDIQTEPKPTVKLGAMEGIFIAGQGADCKYLSYGAEGVDAIRQALQDLEQQMAFLGARMLTPEKRAVETAETARIHRMGEISVLARISNTVSNSLTAAVKFMLEWAGIPTTMDHRVKLDDNFLPTQASPQQVAEMVKAWQGGAISHDSLWRFMQESELVDPQRTVEEELAIIEEETPELEEETQQLDVEGKRIGVEQQRLTLEQQAEGETEPGEA